MAISRREVGALALGAGAASIWGGQLLAAATDTLRTRTVPSTGELLPVIGLGTNRYSVEKVESLREPLRRFHELGGRVVDTAPAYRTSEKALGEIAKQLGITDDLIWATKVHEGSNEALDEQHSASRARLGTKEIDILQIHNLRSWDLALPKLREWKASGKVRYVGITTSRDSQFSDVEKLLADEVLDFLQINYSLEARAAADRILPLAVDRGVGVIVNRALGGGRLFKAVGDSPLPDWAADFDCTSWAQFLLKYVLANEAVTCIIPGMTKVKHVEDNMAAGRGQLPNTDLRARQEAFFDAL